MDKSDEQNVLTGLEREKDQNKKDGVNNQSEYDENSDDLTHFIEDSSKNIENCCSIKALSPNSHDINKSKMSPFYNPTSECVKR